MMRDDQPPNLPPKSQRDFSLLEQAAMGQTKEDGKGVEGAWLDMYYDLRAAGLSQNQAAYAAWYNAPKGTRQPRTLEQLAALLNLKSSQVFHKWRHQQWWRELAIDRMREGVLLNYLADVDRRTIAEALALTGKEGVMARDQFYKQLITPKQRIEHSGPEGQPIEVKGVDFGELSEGQLDKVISGLQAALGAGAMGEIAEEE